MSKRDKRGKAGAHKATSAASGDDTSVDDDAITDEVDESSSAPADADTDADRELRPAGKRSARRRGGVDTLDAEDDAKTKKKKVDPEDSRNPFVRIWLFLSQVVAELKKVIWPTRRELILYTIVVLIFLVILVAIIGGLDIGFAKLMLLIFG